MNANQTMKNYTIANTFHGTNASFRSIEAPDAKTAFSWLETDALYDQTARQKYNRVRRKLCASKGCQCAGMIVSA